MTAFTDVILYGAIYALILYAIFGRLFGRKYGWMGSVFGVALAVITVYPNILVLPGTWYTQFTYAYDNLDTTDLSSPINAMFLMYASMVFYFGIAGLAVLNKLSKTAVKF